MSSLPRHIRLQAAAREMGDVMERYAEAAAYDYPGYDYGEFSGPASSRAMERDLFGVAARFRVPWDAAYQTLMFACDDGDAVGHMMGTNR